MQINSQHSLSSLGFFHDGDIIAIEKRGDDILLTISICYLAHMISKEMYLIYALLKKCDELHFLVWDNNEILSDFCAIAQLEPEILQVETEKGKTVIQCALIEGSGGTLTLRAESVVIYDQNKKEIPLFELEKLVKAYWLQGTDGKTIQTGD